MLMDESEENINEEESDVDFPEYKNINKKKRKRGKNKVINDLSNMRDIELDESTYEIEIILKHRIINHKYEFLVKWKDYDSKHNSWVKETDFNEKDIIKDYNYIIYKL